MQIKLLRLKIKIRKQIKLLKMENNYLNKYKKRLPSMRKIINKNKFNNHQIIRGLLEYLVVNKMLKKNQGKSKRV